MPELALGTPGEASQSSFTGLLMKSGDDITRKWKLQRSYLFEFLLPDVNGVNGIEVSAYCTALKFGEYNISEVSKIRYGAYKKGYAGFLDVENVVAKFWRPVPDLVGMYFRAWKNLIVDERGFYWPKNNYAKTAFVKFFDRDGAESGTYRLTGLFPTKFPAFDLSYESQEAVSNDIEFNVDRVYAE